MLRLSFALLVALSAAPHSAYAEAQKPHLGSPEQQRACRPDILRHCRAVMDQSDEAMAACLHANARSLSSACRAALETARRN